MSSFWLNATIDVLLVIYVADCLFMGLVIMMQRSKQEGLGAAFGGGMMEGAFGAQTSQVLVRATVWAAALFFILSVSLARLYSMRESTSLSQTSAVQQELEKSSTHVPAAGPAATNAAPLAAPSASTPAVTPPAASSPAPATPAPATKPATPSSPTSH